MPYLLASILAFTSAMIILLSRYEADDTFIKSEIDSMEVMFSMVDGFVNTYIESGESISDVNFQVLRDNGILLSNATVTGVGNFSVLQLPNSNIVWQLIPNKDDSSSYKVFVDFRNSSGLMSKSRFSESFIGREFCQNNLFGTFETLINAFDDNGTETILTDDDFVNLSASGTNEDGMFSCIVFK